MRRSHKSTKQQDVRSKSASLALFICFTLSPYSFLSWLFSRTKASALCTAHHQCQYANNDNCINELIMSACVMYRNHIKGSEACREHERNIEASIQLLRFTTQSRPRRIREIDLKCGKHVLHFKKKWKASAVPSFLRTKGLHNNFLF